MKKLFWGCDLSTWMSQLRRARSQGFNPVNRHIGVTTAVCAMNSMLGALQRNRMRSTLATARIRSDPIFVIGHWRSGTTLAHELLCLNPATSFPNNYCCFAPHHFLISEHSVGPYFDRVAPKNRPMDDVGMVWNAPQEDEFATCGLGANSVYWRFGFPGSNFVPLHDFDYSGNSKEWEAKFMEFARALTVRSSLRLVFKSPTHSFRIPHLLTLFPDAKFVYMQRDPEETILSFQRMLQQMVKFASFEPTVIPGTVALEAGFVDLNHTIASSIHSLGSCQVVVVHYDELLHNTMGTVERLMCDLDMTYCEVYRERVKRHMQLASGHRPHTCVSQTGVHSEFNCRIWAMRQE